MQIRLIFLTVVVAVVSLSASCGGDNSTGPGSNQNVQLPAGSYLVTIEETACPVPASYVTGAPLTFEYTSCADTDWSYFLGPACPISATATSVSLDCTYNVNNGLCSTTYRVAGSGAKSGDTWTVGGTRTITSEIPAGCSGQPDCAHFAVTVQEQSIGAPSACQYGEVNTVSANITGGPLGDIILDVAFAFPTPGTSGWLWDLVAFYGSPVQPTSTMRMSIPETSPSDLPKSFPITVPPIGAALVIGGVTDTLWYDESYENGGGYTAESATSGTVTVYEVSDKHIAGTYSVATSGTEFTPPSASGPSTRTLSGSFHVRVGSGESAVKYPAWPGLIEAMKMLDR